MLNQDTKISQETRASYRFPTPHTVFTDASLQLYGAVAYLRHEYQSGDTSVCFNL